MAPDAWLRLSIARTVRSPAGTATPRTAQTYNVETEKTFFVSGFSCHQQCESDSRNPLRFTTKVEVDDFAAGVSVVDSATAKGLPFANVSLLDTRLGANTQMDGGFRVRNVPPGTYSMRASYIGYDPAVQSVTVTAGATATIRFQLHKKAAAGTFLPQ